MYEFLKKIIYNISPLTKWVKRNFFLLLIILTFPVFFYFKNILSYINTLLDEMKNNTGKINKIKSRMPQMNR